MSIRVEDIRGPTTPASHFTHTTKPQRNEPKQSPPAAYSHSIPCGASSTVMSNNSLFIAVLVLVCYSGCCAAFGAGNIPSVAFLEGKAFRHGDIEDILAELLIRAASSNISTGFGAKSSGKKFSELNVKRTYFGNWL